MKKIKITLIIVLTLLITNCIAQNNQSKFSFELNAGPSFATQSLAGTDLNVGGGFEGIFNYQLMTHLGVYAGWGWNKSPSSESFQEIDADFEETGYVFGLQFKHPFRSSQISWVVRLGGLYNHLEIEDSEGEILWDTGHGLGIQAAAGLDVPLGMKWSLSPMIKFHSLSRDLDIESTTNNFDLRYFAPRVGIVRQF